MNYLYNGVELPALPEWDKTVYPYATILNPLDTGVTLWVTTLPYKVSTAKGNMIVSAGTVEQCYVVADGAWVHHEPYPPEDAEYTTFLPNFGWANYDVINVDNNTVYFSSSDPVPVNPAHTLDPTSMLMGWLVGKRVAGMRKTQTDVPVVPDEPDVPETPTGDPVAYLYNGVRLPDINEVWDKTAYPYAVIFDGTEAEGLPYCLVFAETTVTLQSGVDDGIYAAVGGDFYYSEDGTSWVSAGEFGTEVRNTAFIWTSHDILNPDGTTYLAASEPIPVYE